MIHLSLLAHSERVYQDVNFFPNEFSRQGYFPLYAQWRTYDALVNGDANIVINTYATGSGKTKAALLYLRELRRRVLAEANCLFIAPTNELLQQHANDIQGFCQRNDLDYDVLPLTGAYIDEYAEVVGQSAPEMTRRAAKLVEILKNPRVLKDVDSRAASQQRPYVLVTNPDIFYYAVYNGYGRNEERALMSQFLGGFDYLVIDEFHYYNPKQLANFLFFLSVWRHFGFFEKRADRNGAKVCLLSATPNTYVRHYLHSLDLPLVEVSPDNEPEDANAPRVASLAPVELDALTSEETGDRGLVDLVAKGHVSELRRWLADDQQGAIISGALWRINLLYSELLRAGIHKALVARLTGVQTREARAQAAQCDLILATPTVDLGYNFERKGKPRQSIDFLFFDAAFSDEFVQRLGRVGRVLGKRETTIPSRALAVLPQELIEALRPLEGRSITRAELRDALGKTIENGRLQEHNTIFDYISSGAIQEALLPILRLRDMAGMVGMQDIEELYEQVRRLFKADERTSFKRLLGVTKQFREGREVFRNAPTEPQELVSHILKVPDNRGVRIWLKSKARDGGEPSANVLAQVKDKVSKPESPLRSDFTQWAIQTQMEHAVREASFSFRESFDEPLARIHDPHHLVSDDDINVYGLFHAVQNCKLEVLGAAQWTGRSGVSTATRRAEQIVLYCAVHALRAYEERLRLRFRLRVDDERRVWEGAHVCKMTALLGLEVFSEVGQLPIEVIDALKSQFVPAFLAPREKPIGGRLIGLARSQGLRSYDVAVTFAMGAPCEYCMMLGTSALLAAARLRRESAIFHKSQEKDFQEPIWC